jgi:hypothetical protein
MTLKDARRCRAFMSLAFRKRVRMMASARSLEPPPMACSSTNLCIADQSSRSAGLRTCATSVSSRFRSAWSSSFSMSGAQPIILACRCTEQCTIRGVASALREGAHADCYTGERRWRAHSIDRYRRRIGHVAGSAGDVGTFSSRGSHFPLTPLALSMAWGHLFRRAASI